MIFEPRHKAKNKNFPGGLWGRGNSRPSKENVQRENDTHRAGDSRVAKAQNIDKESIPTEVFSSVIYFLRYFSFWYFSPTFILGRWRLSRKRVWSQTLKEMKWKLPGSVGSSDEALLPGPEPSPHRMPSRIAEVQVSTCHDSSTLGSVYWTLLFVVISILTGNPEVVALERLWCAWSTWLTWLLELVNYASFSPLCLAHSTWMWFVVVPRVRKRASYFGVGMISFWWSYVTYMSF